MQISSSSSGILSMPQFIQGVSNDRWWSLRWPLRRGLVKSLTEKAARSCCGVPKWPGKNHLWGGPRHQATTWKRGPRQPATAVVPCVALEGAGRKATKEGQYTPGQELDRI